MGFFGSLDPIDQNGANYPSALLNSSEGSTTTDLTIVRTT
jgi:hypothetical protein